MQNLRNKLMAVAAVGVLGTIGSMMTPHHATAQTAPTNGPSGSAPVTIVSPLPLPITGSTTVSGTVAATQSGLWNMRNLDDRGRVAYQVHSVIPLRLPPVPQGHRLVIEHVSGELGFIQTPGPFGVFIDLLKAGENVENIIGGFVPTLLPSPLVTPFDHAVLIYVNPGDTLDVTVAGPSGGGTLNVSGYMLDCTITPCSAMTP